MTRIGHLASELSIVMPSEPADLCVFVLNCGLPPLYCKCECKVGEVVKIGSGKVSKVARVCLSCRVNSQKLRDSANLLCYRIHQQRSALLAKKTQEDPTQRRKYHT